VPPATSRHEAFAVCTPGLESALDAELRGLGIGGVVHHGGVSLRLSTRQLYEVNLWSRVASRILVRVARFDARTFLDLERAASRIEWRTWLASGVRPVFRVTSLSSRLYHTGAIAERLLAIVQRAVSGPADGAGPEQLFVVRVHRDGFTISVDSSGEVLHRRGWRLATAKAPLRETLAAAMLLVAGWEPDQPLIDPFCGSGTIPIEAALLATNRPPGAGRSFAFERWPSFAPGTWASVLESARRASEEPRRRSDPPVIIGSDRDAGAIEAAQANAQRAGVADLVELRRATISEVEPPASTPNPGWILTNPPYGKRISSTGDLRDLYARLGQVARSRFPGWSVGLLAADRRLAAHTALPLHERFRTSNGALAVRLLTAELRPPSRTDS
jgi:putative N6-adenine-specific DNA methylase